MLNWFVVPNLLLGRVRKREEHIGTNSFVKHQLNKPSEQTEMWSRLS